MRSQHPTDVLERENEAYRRFLDERDRREKVETRRVCAVCGGALFLTVHPQSHHARRRCSKDESHRGKIRREVQTEEEKVNEAGMTGEDMVRVGRCFDQHKRNTCIKCPYEDGPECAWVEIEADAREED